MAKPIDHSFGSAAATTGWGAVKGGIIGAALVGLIAGGVVGLIVGGLASLAVGATAAAVIGGIAGVITGLGSMFTVGGAVGAGAGTLIGAFKGSSRVGKERASFQHKMEQREHTHDTKQNTAAMAGMQQGYMVGFQEGQQYVVSQLQRAQEQMLMAKAEPAKDKDCPVCTKHVDALNKQRAAQAASTPQIG
jgi:hypothetical protein